MQFRKHSPCLMVLCLALVAPSFAQQPKSASADGATATSITVNGPVTAGSTINVTPAVSGIVYVYVQPSAKVTDGDTCSAKAATFPISQSFLNVAPKAQDLALTVPLAKGDALCVYLYDAKTGKNGFAADVPAIVAAPNGVVDPKPSLVGSAIAGNSITVSAPIGASVTVYIQPKAAGKPAANCNGSSVDFTGSSQTFSPSTTATQQLSLNTALQPGDQICLASSSPTAPAPSFSALFKAVSAPGVIQPTFAGKLISGSSTLSVNGTPQADISVYAFDPGDAPSDLNNCGAELGKAQLLNVTISGKSGSQNSVPLDTGNPPFTITLAQPMTSGSLLCLSQTPKAVAGAAAVPSTVYSGVQVVVDPLDFGRFQIGFTGGAIISNETQSSSSSTVSTYLDAYLQYSWAISKKHQTSAIQSFFDAQLSAIPVAAQATTTATSATSSTLTQSLNALTTQQSARILVGLSAPFRIVRWSGDKYGFSIGPLARAGFDTLLNPKATDNFNASQSSGSSNVTTANFSSVYDFWSFGLRTAFSRYTASTAKDGQIDEAPKTYTWLSVAAGNFSNLPSYVCSTTKSYTVSATTAPTTSCTLVATTGATQTSYAIFNSRKLIPRIDIAGEARLPSIPIIFGLNANLGQYSIGASKLDTLNKPGNDVRIYIGYTLDLNTALAKFGVK